MWAGSGRAGRAGGAAGPLRHTRLRRRRRHPRGASLLAAGPIRHQPAGGLTAVRTLRDLVFLVFVLGSAITGSQVPGFVDAYAQRLGGALDEARAALASFAPAAASSRLGFAEYRRTAESRVGTEGVRSFKIPGYPYH